MKNKIVFGALSAVLAVGVVAGVAAKTGVTAQAKNQPTLVMATSADYKPYEFHDTSSGQDKIVGFDIDIANAIANHLHFKMQVEDMDFNGLLGALQAKRADFVIAGMTPTADRKKSVDFSEVYYAAQNTIISKKGTKYTTLASLKGKKVAAQLGSIQESLAKKIPNVKLDSLTAIPTIIEEVKTGRADAAIIEGTVGKGYIQNNADLQMNPIKGMAENGSAIAFPKGSKWVKQFNQVIELMKKDGEMNRLIKKWFGK